MTVKEITSAQNHKYKYFKSLKTKKTRDNNRQYTVEGIKSVNDAINAGADIDCVIVSNSFGIDISTETVYKLPDELFARLCDTETPQGVMAVINMPPKNKKTLSQDKLYLYCDKVTDPGNVGTIIRICDAADCGLLLSRGTADIYNPKTVRASMGSFFHTEITESITVDDIESFRVAGFKIICSTLSGNTSDYRYADYGGSTIIVVGNEANGISDEILALADVCVKIPIWGKAESLNVGVASALLVYEAQKKRKT
ncbi:MAG: RNA methyltransferase [Firmicutes bacterium]|nr:RNA methyltransferase [Bacillota bacterium]